MEDGGGCCLTSGSDLTTTTKRSKSGSDWPFPWYQALGELNALVYFRMISHPTLVTHFLETTEFKNLKIFFFSVFTVRTCETRSKSPLWSPLWIGPLESLTLKLSSNFGNVGFPAPVSTGSWGHFFCRNLWFFVPSCLFPSFTLWPYFSEGSKKMTDFSACSAFYLLGLSDVF